MSPEQLDGRPAVDHRSDIYSLGATIYELLTGRPAFDSQARASLVHDVLHVSPTPLREIDCRIPRDLETIVCKCLSKETHERYQSAIELATDLRLFLDRRPIKAKRINFVETIWKWSRRNRGLAVVGMIAATALLILAVGGPFAAMQLLRRAGRRTVENARA